MENFSTTTPISEAMIKDYFDMSDDNSQSLSTDNNLWNFTTDSWNFTDFGNETNATTPASVVRVSFDNASYL